MTNSVIVNATGSIPRYRDLKEGQVFGWPGTNGFFMRAFNGYIDLTNGAYTAMGPDCCYRIDLFPDVTIKRNDG